MTETAIFYLIIDALLIAYACYSWYWQANIELRGTYRSSSIIWALIFIWIGFMWNYLEKGDQSLNFFLALFLLTSIIDGFAGFAPKRIVVSGYFKRTIRYSEVVTVTLIAMPGVKKENVICLVTTKKNRQYYIRFSQGVSKIVSVLKKYVKHDIQIEIQNIM
ncbi:hypothetical protein PT285_01615 [Lactobacillus sp. ESL0791]|uniref:hypothetical protein n=1 Tax=Lactobacillus sp. ESL0791 TaxID=2983234 RepID=UPI0023F6F88A|nr:hypothetical protein [Lactobacillus sp. ESL0791]MDF7638135.1 hypothetical protein [Lactobacillus sp. ESL0791]